MTESELIPRYLVGGAINAAILVAIAFALSRFVRDAVGRSLLVIFLFTAGGAYFGFAIGAGARPIWALAELIQVVVFGTFALLGLRGSPYWLALGWALHPVWDFGLHYLGPGQPFTPASYAISCITFDLVVAGYVAIVYGVIGSRRMGFRDADSREIGLAGAGKLATIAR